MLENIGPDIWIADGTTVVAAMGFHYPTRMAVIRLDNGGLIIWSPVALSDDLRRAINALGPVSHLVAPNALHHVFIADWLRAYPGARIHGAPGLSAKRKDIVFDTELGDDPVPTWADDIDQVLIANAIAPEIVFFHVKSGTALFTDLIQHLPAGWFSGWRRLVAKLDLMTAREPSVPRKFRLAMKRRAARPAIDRILAWPVMMLVMAHGAPVRTNARRVIARAFRWLDR